EIGVEFPVDHREHVAIESRRHSGGVVIRVHQPIDVLDQIGAQQQAVPWADRSDRTRSRGPGVRLPIVAPRKTNSRRPPLGISARCSSKSPQTALISTSGYSPWIAFAVAR